ncbi:hypothetical protein F5Y03DRAFT_406408 [Xylaria venustula]|nr:hypothetical protein F5Y03DRAFT_406408 [Xylaria venustula]
MYSIWAANKGENPPAAEFSADAKKYGRGSACNECRISRVRCSGKLDGSDCDRCKRLSKSCLYTGSRRSRQKKRRSTTSTRVPSPVRPGSANQTPDALGTPASSPPDLSSWNQSQCMTGDPLVLDVNAWESMLTEPPLPKSVVPQQTEVSDVLDFASFPIGATQPVMDSDKTLVSHFCTPSANKLDIDDATDHVPTSSNIYQDVQDWVFASQGTTSQCTCLQATTSSLADLRSWAWSQEIGSGTQVNPCSVGLNYAKVEDFLNLFTKSMENLQRVEDCSRICILSQELAILLLLVVENLAKLLTSLAADSTGTSYRLPLSPPSSKSIFLHSTTNNSSQLRQGIRRARFGSVELKDPLDLNMIMKTLLQIRTRSLNEYIGRWNEKIQHYGLSSLEADLEKIREDLDKVIFLDNLNERASSTSSSSSGSIK